MGEFQVNGSNHGGILDSLGSLDPNGDALLRGSLGPSLDQYSGRTGIQITPNISPNREMYSEAVGLSASKGGYGSNENKSFNESTSQVVGSDWHPRFRSNALNPITIPSQEQIAYLLASQQRQDALTGNTNQDQLVGSEEDFSAAGADAGTAKSPNSASSDQSSQTQNTTFSFATSDAQPSEQQFMTTSMPPGSSAPSEITTAWIRQLGSGGTDSRGVAVDRAGNIYITGSTSNNLARSASGIRDAWVAKYNSQGSLTWVRQLGASNADYARSIAVDDSGNVYLAGNSNGSLNGSSATSGPWLAKYDTNGSLSWYQQSDFTSSEETLSITTDTAGNIYMSGSGRAIDPTVGLNDAWIAKYDSSGNQTWVRQWGTANRDYARSVTVDGAGNVYVAGEYKNYTGGTESDGQQGWLAKYNLNGKLVWQRLIGASDPLVSDYASGVAVDSAGSVYITGYTNGSLAGAGNVGKNDAWLFKYDSQGNVEWKRQMGTVNQDYAYGIALDGTGGVFVAGRTTGALEGDKNGVIDSWVAMYDNNGNQLWVEQIGFEDYTEAFGVAVDGTGNVYLSGQTRLESNPDTAYKAWLAKLTQPKPAIAASLVTDTGTSATDQITSQAQIGGIVSYPNRVVSLRAGFNSTPTANFVNVLADMRADGTFSFSQSRLAQIYGVQLPQGTHTLHLQAADKYGNLSNVARVTFTLDTQAPGVPDQLRLASESDTGASSANNITRVSAPVVQGRAEAGSSIRILKAGQLVGQGITGTDGIWKITANGLADGTHSLGASATDVAGNVSAISAPFNLVIDTALPLLTLTTPVDTTPLTFQSRLKGTLEGTGSGVASFTYRFDNLQEVAVSFGADGSFDQAFNLSGISAGTHLLTLTTTDAAGNSTTKAFNVMVDEPVLVGIGNASDNTITGSNGKDALYGKEGNDVLIGRAGDDFLDGGTGRDSLTGGIGNDVYVVDDLLDTVTENPNEGIDRIETSVSFDLDLKGDQVEHLLLVAGAGDIDGAGNELDNRIEGNEGNNRIRGGEGNDTLLGLGGNDTLQGGNGSDLLDGGSGNDILQGSDGGTDPSVSSGQIDTLTGGAGADRFVLGDVNRVFYDDGDATSAGTADYALITDFNPAEGDIVQLHGSRSDYFLADALQGMPSGTAIYRMQPGGGTAELIAIVQNASGLTLASDRFEFTSAPSTFSFGAVTYRVGEAGSAAATVTVIRTGNSAGGASVTLTSSDGTASAPDDYAAISQVVTFAEGETQKSIQLAIVRDAVFEADEQFSITLGSPSNGALLGEVATTTVTIANNNPSAFTVALSKDTAANGLTNTDGITSNPTIQGTVAGESSIVAFQAGFGETPIANYKSILGALKSDGSFVLERAQLAAINGGSLPDGTYTLHLRTQDEFGNWSAVSDVSFTLDTAAPKLNITSLIDGIRWKEGEPFKGTVSAADGADSVTYSFNGGEKIALSLGDSEVSGLKGFEQALDLPDSFGAHTLTVSATDLAGNEQVTQYQFLVKQNRLAQDDDELAESDPNYELLDNRYSSSLGDSWYSDWFYGGGGTSRSWGSGTSLSEEDNLGDGGLSEDVPPEGCGYLLDNYLEGLAYVLDQAIDSIDASTNDTLRHRKAALINRANLLMEIGDMVDEGKFYGRMGRPNNRTDPYNYEGDILHGIYDRLQSLTTFCQAGDEGEALAAYLTNDTDAVRVEVYQVALLAVVNRVFLDKSYTPSSAAEYETLVDSLLELGRTYAALNPTETPSTISTTPDFLGSLWRAQLPSANVQTELAKSITALGDLLVGVENPAQALKFINNLLQAATNIASLDAEAIYDAEFLRELVAFGFEYAKLNPTELPEATDNGLDAFLATLWQDAPDDGIAMRQATGKLGQLFEGLSTLEERIQSLRFGRQLLQAVEQLPGELQMEKHNPQFLSTLVKLGASYAALNPAQTAETTDLSNFFLNTLWQQQNTEEFQKGVQELKDWLENFDEFKHQIDTLTLGNSFFEKVRISSSFDKKDTTLSALLDIAKFAVELEPYLTEHSSEPRTISQAIADDVSGVNWEQVERTWSEIMAEQNYLTDPDYYPLTLQEREILSSIFKNSIDYSVIRIARFTEFTEDILGVDLNRYATGLTLGNRIYLADRYEGRSVFDSDGRTLTDEGLELLFHEVTHVWQYQNGGWIYGSEALWSQFVASAFRGNISFAYEWEEALDTPWEDWNPEQQAQFVEEFYELLVQGIEEGFTDQRLEQISDLFQYILQIQDRQGAPEFETVPYIIN